MSLLAKVTRGKIATPHFVIIYGPDGVGKTSFAASAPNPIFLEPEQGSANQDVARFPGVKTFAEARAAVNELRTEKHDYKTLAIDSIDWLEPLVWAQVCVEGGGVKLIDEAYGGYGKGYTAATRLWAEFIADLKALRQEKSMNVVLVAHSHVKTFNDPYQAQPYDRHQLKLNDKAAALWREAVDAVLFATYETFVTNPEKGKKAKAFGDGKRVLYTERRPSFDAKNRDGLPFEIPLSWQEYSSAVNKSEPSELALIKKDIEDRIAGETDGNLKALMEKGYKNAGDNLQNLGIILNTIKARQGA